MTDTNYISPDKNVEFRHGKVHITGSEHVSAVFSKHKSTHHNAMHLNCPESSGPVHHHEVNQGSGHKLDEDRIAMMNPGIYDNLANATHQGITEMIVSPDKVHHEIHLQREDSSPSHSRRRTSERKSSMKKISS